MALLDALRRKKPSPPRTHSSITQFASISLASASLSSPLAQVAGGGTGWQKKAWDFYDVVPEMRLVVGYRASALSKVKLTIAKTTPDGDELITDQRSEAMLETLFGGIANHPSALSRYAQHLTIIGETYTFVVKDEDGRDEWLIVPADQVNFNRKTLRFTHPITGVDVSYDVEDLYNFRLWQPHPHKFWEADSPTRGGISSLDKIQAIDASIKATALSRLTGAGLYPMPLEASLPGPTEDAQGSPEDEFQREFHRVTSMARADPNSAAASNPIFVWMPAEAIKAMLDKPISFWSDFDDQASEMRDNEIRRYATGQPLPTEMVTGLQNVNHWTGWQLSEEDLKFDIAPLAQLICDALTVRVVQPVMGSDFVVVPDFSDLVTRPNRTPETLEIFTAGAASINELRESAGLPPIDGGNTVGTLVTPDGDGEEPPMQVDSQRTQPAQIDRAQDPATFASAQMLARDLVYTAGQWLLTHSGRANRPVLESVSAMERHVTFHADESVITEAVNRVKPKYEDVVSTDLFDRVVGYVGHICDGRERYSAEGLSEWVNRGS